jgi:hypothetical protein
MYTAFCRTAKEVHLGRSVEARYLGAVGTVHADLTAVDVLEQKNKQSEIQKRRMCRSAEATVTGTF